MTRATRISQYIYERLSDVAGAPVYRGVLHVQLRQDAALPVINLRTNGDRVTGQLNDSLRCQREFLVEVLSADADPEPVLDDLLLRIRDALSVDDARPLGGMVVSAQWGQAEYEYPQDVDDSLTVLRQLLTVIYVENL